MPQVDAWLLVSDDQITDQRAENRRSPNVAVQPEELRALGVFYYKMDPKTMLLEAGAKGVCPVDAIMSEMKYKNRDQVVCSPEKLENYDQKLKFFFTEHIHEDDEIRIIQDGCGYFDVRNQNDEWVRVACNPGDLLVLPAGIYHRFTMDSSNFTHAIRLFKDVANWTPINRPCDDNQVRQAYVAKYLSHSNSVAATGLSNEDSVVGPVNGSTVMVNEYPWVFDQVVKGILKNQLNREKKDALMIYFTGNTNPLSGNSWCPDCDDNKDAVQAAHQNAVEALKEQGRKVVFLQCNVERASYRDNAEYLYRKHPFLMVNSIPCLMVCMAKGSVENDDEEGLEVVATQKDKLNDVWLQPLLKAGKA